MLACVRQWGLADDDPRLNPNGGALRSATRWACRAPG
nr:hypothetical protein [Rhodothermus marinus]